MNALVVPMTRRPDTPDWLQRWGRFAATIRFDDLPADVVARTCQVFYDAIGAIAAGAQEPEVRAIAQRMDALHGAGGTAPLIGLHRRATPPASAFVNGTAGTMLELDEGNQYARGHPGIHVVPALFAAAARRDASGPDLITALAIGYEIGARIGIASKLRVTMHPHGTWGTVGAAVAVARLAGASPAVMVEVINVASTLGLATSRRTMLEGGTVRNTFAGWSNQIGLTVPELVAAGFSGEADGLGTVYGTVSADDWQPALMEDELGSRWEIARNYFKRHACCRYNHAALDALQRIVAESGPIAAEAIERVDVHTYVWAAQLAGQAPHNMLAAKFSLPFSIATTLVHGEASIPAFREPALHDARITALAARVFVAESPEMTAMLPALRPADVVLTLRDGRRLQARSLTNKGDTEDPYAEADVQAKFLEITGPVWDDATARRILQGCEDLPRQTSTAPLLELLAH